MTQNNNNIYRVGQKSLDTQCLTKRLRQVNFAPSSVCIAKMKCVIRKWTFWVLIQTAFFKVKIMLLMFQRRLAAFSCNILCNKNWYRQLYEVLRRNNDSYLRVIRGATSGEPWQVMAVIPILLAQKQRYTFWSKGLKWSQCTQAGNLFTGPSWNFRSSYIHTHHTHTHTHTHLVHIPCQFHDLYEQ